MKNQLEWLLTAALLVLLTTLGVVYRVPAADAPDVPDYHIVEMGDTYWSIARTYWPGQHTGERVHELTQLNLTAPDGLRAGQRVRLVP